MDTRGKAIPGVSHNMAEVNGTRLHYVTAGASGAPILLIHGFPESWWAFHDLIPLLAANHRVYALDLRGFGDSAPAAEQDDAEVLATDLQALLDRLDAGPMHLLAQDISGSLAFRVAARSQGGVRSLTLVESGLPGFGLEALADVAKGGAWYFGLLATPGAADAFLKDRERLLIGEFIMPFATAAPGGLTQDDINELARGFARPGGWSGALALYRSALRDGELIRNLARRSPLTLPCLAVDRAGSDFAYKTLSAVHAGAVQQRTISGAGHYIALEAPRALAEALLGFIAAADADRGP